MYALRIGAKFLFSSVQRRKLSVSSRNVTDAATKDGELRVFIVSGEVSGDNIAARLMVSLKKILPLPIRFSGVGGSMMTQQGLKSLFPMEDLAVMGIWELLPHLYKIRVGNLLLLVFPCYVNYHFDSRSTVSSHLFLPHRFPSSRFSMTTTSDTHSSISLFSPSLAPFSSFIELGKVLMEKRKDSASRFGQNQGGNTHF